MKKLYIGLFAAYGVMFALSAHAASVCTSSGGDIVPMASWTGLCPGGGRNYISIDSDPWANCKTRGYWCFYNTSGQAVTLPTCVGCASGYELKTNSVTNTAISNICSNNVYYDSCVKAGTSTTVTCNKTECEANNNTYYPYNEQYQIAYKYNCSNNSCVKNPIVTYRCNTGYYGGVSTSMTGCTRCPVLPDRGTDGNLVYGITMGAGKTAITDCITPTGSFEDKTGIYSFNGPCAYTK